MSEQKQRVYDALNKLGIKYEVVEHEPVHTMEDMDRLGLPEKGTLCKNLFLRDAKGKRHFLITCDENARLKVSWQTARCRKLKLCLRRTSRKISRTQTGKRISIRSHE